MKIKLSVAAIMVAALAVAEGNAKRFSLESLPVKCERAVTVAGREPSLLPSGRKGRARADARERSPCDGGERCGDRGA